MFYGLGQVSGATSFDANGVLAFDRVTAADVRREVITNASGQLDENTPGGATIKAWQDEGYPKDYGDLAQVVAAGLSKSKNRVVREGAQTAAMMGGQAFSACSATGVGAAAAPLCGAVGLAWGAVAGSITAAMSARIESGTDLRGAVFSANESLLNGILAIRAAFESADMGVLNNAQAACLIVDAMKARGSSLTDRIWGPYTTKAAAHSSPCGIPGLLCWDGWNRLTGMRTRSSQGLSPEWPQYAIMEKWWMLNDDHYGNCVSTGDVKKMGGAYTGKTTTRQKRAKRMAKLAEQLADAVEVVLATMINLKDQRSRELAAAYYRSKQYQEDIAKAGAGVSATQQSYGDFMRASGKELRDQCGMSQAEASALLAQGSKVFMPVLLACRKDRKDQIDHHDLTHDATHVATHDLTHVASNRDKVRQRSWAAIAALSVVAVGVVGVGGYVAYTRVKTGSFR